MTNIALMNPNNRRTYLGDGDALALAERSSEMNANRQKLIDALRAPMPEKFKWDFGTVLDRGYCGSMGCALGLATIIFPDKITDCMAEDNKINTDDDAAIATFFGLKTVAMLWKPSFYGQYTRNCEVTPSMVADALEAAEVMI